MSQTKKKEKEACCGIDKTCCCATEETITNTKQRAQRIRQAVQDVPGIQSRGGSCDA